MKAKYVYHVSRTDYVSRTDSYGSTTTIGTFSKPILAVRATEKQFKDVDPSRNHIRPTQTILNILREEGIVTEFAYHFTVTIQELELDKP